MRGFKLLHVLLIAGFLSLLVLSGPATARVISPFESSTTPVLPGNDALTERDGVPSQALAPGDPVDFDAALIAGADYLKHMQADVTDDNAGNGTNGIDETPNDPDDAGWDWSVTSPPAPFFHTTAASPTNIYGATAQGLYYAYLETGDASYFTALKDFADKAVAAGPSVIRAGADIKMLLLFNDLYSTVVGPTTVYADAAKAKYDGRIAVYGSATALAAYIRDARNSQGYPNGIIGWDIGVYAVVAQMLYANYGGTYDQDADAIAEVLWQDSFNDTPGYYDVVDDAGWDPTWTDKNFWWYTLGLTGLIDAFSASGSHTDEIPGLAQRLLDSQYGGGGISGSYGANPDDEDWQSTGYAAMCLGTLDQATYQDALNRMGYWAGATQHSSGGWLYSSGAHYPETCGEITAALYFTTNDLTVALVDDDFIDQAAVDAYNTANGTNYTWGYDAFATIQGGVNAVTGSTVYVNPGVYEEQVVITGDVQVIGSGVGVTTIQSPADLAVSFGASTQNYPVVLVQNAANATISDLTVDGLGRGNLNYRFVGIGFSDAGGGVYNCEVLNIMDTPFSGAQHGVGIYAWNDDGNARTITVEGCLVEGFQKTGMALNANDASPLTVAVTGNTVNGAGATTVTAQNGIQVWSSTASGTVEGNTVTGIAYDNTSATTKWVATSILNYYADLDITGNTVTGTHVGIYNIDGAGTIAENDFTIEKIGVSAYGIIATDPPDAVPSPVDADLIASARPSAAQQAAALLNVAILKNTVTFSGGDNTATTGIEADAGWAVDNLAVTVNENFVNGFEVGLGFWVCESDCGTSVFTGVTAQSNSLVGNTYGVYSNVPYLTVNASTNWFGTTDPTTVGGMISGAVDYTPWLGLGTDADPVTPGFQATLSDLWVDDNSAQIGTVGRINEAVGIATAAGTVNVAAGAYEEQVVIDKNLSLFGAGAGSTLVNSPSTLPVYFMTGTNYNRPIVYVHDANVSISGVTVDGLGRGNANYRFIGVAFWNAGGSVTDCHVTRITDTPFSGSQHGNGVYAYNNTGGPYAISLAGVTVDNFQKNGITLLGAGLTAAVTDCSVLGVGATSVTAQNGIQLGYGSSGEIVNSTVDGIAYSGTGWIASGMLFYQGVSVDITGCEITNSQACVVYQETNGAVIDLSVETSGVAGEEGISVRDYGYVKAAGKSIPAISPVDDYLAVVNDAKAAATNVSIEGATLTGTANGGYGVAAWSLGDNVNVSVNNSDLSNWEIGLVAYEDGSEVSLGGSHNRIFGNLYGMWTNAAAPQAVEQNYWGSFDGPADVAGTMEASIGTCFPAGDMMNAVAETQPALGDTADGLVDYCPWTSSGVQFSTDNIVHHCPGSITFDIEATEALTALEGANIAIAFPAALSFAGATVANGNYQLLPISQSSDGIGYDTVFIPFIVKTGWLDGPATMYTVTMTANDDICAVDQISMISADLRDTANVGIPTPMSLPIDITVDCADPVFATTTADGGFYNVPPVLAISGTDNCDLDGVYYQIDGCDSWTAIVTGLTGGAYAASWTLPAADFAALSEAEHCLRFKVSDDAGRVNGDSCAFTWCFTKDVTNPPAPTALVAHPGHNKVKLSWVNPTTDFDHVVIMRTDWNAVGHGYPHYASLNGSAEGPYPTGLNTGDMVLSTTASSHTDVLDLSNATRDIYHYAAFAVDAAGNVSAPATARSTSYWIGDVAGGGGFGDYDGYVFAEDLNPLGIVYGTADGDLNFDGQLDYGPTVPGGAKDIPVPDDSVNFEDGILFAINFDAVTPAMKVTPIFDDQTVTGPFAISLTPVEGGYALSVVNNAGDVKGIHAVLNVGSNTTYGGTMLSEPVKRTTEPLFSKTIEGSSTVTFDLMLLGKDRTIIGSGELATLLFATTDGSAPQVTVQEVSVRDLGNEELKADVLMGPAAGLIPESFALDQNYPNPFNPATTIGFSLPTDAFVSLEIYNALGQRVRTLVNGHLQAGVHAVEWDSRDESGNRVSSGIYLYRITAGDFTETRKMLLIK